MPKIYYIDGTVETVTYNEAAELKAVLDGVKEPDEKTGFRAMQIAHIDWSDLKKAKQGHARIDREALKQAMTSPLLHGKARFDAIRDAFRGK